MSTTAALYRMVTYDHVCPFGLKAKYLLERKGFDIDDHLLADRQETDHFKREHGVDTTPQVFIDGERIGGYEALRDHLGLSTGDDDDPTYAPVIALFATTFAMALAATWATSGTLLVARTAEWFIAISMCVLAILKLRDVDAFSNQFLGYDLLAQRYVPYAYIYPFAEAFAGIAMLGGVLLPLACAAALSIGSVGAVSVFKAVYIDRRELKCACVGGNSNVPLGFVSLTENLMMIAMGGWMLVK